jgi:eukaryotic-like serine/threonine-protein kinase
MENKIFLGKYRVSAEEIGSAVESADSAIACEGEEIDSGKKVVVEVVPAGSLKPAVRERLEAEATAAKKMNHVNIPALYDFGVEDDQLVYITEDFEGTVAEEWVNQHGPMPVGPVLRIAAQVVSALGTAAFHRINHHAINPGNLVLVPGQTAEGEWPLIKVLHFVGVAPKFSGPGAAVAAFDKSLHYASPEQIQRGTVDFRSEIYSLGCTMWFLLTGAPPLTTPSGPMAEPLTQTGLAQTGLALDKIGGLPKTVSRLLAQMLSVNPEARPRDPLAFYQQLQDSLAQVERRETISRKFGIPVISTSREAGTLRRRRSPMKVLALAALFLALAGLVALALPAALRHRRVVRAEEPIGVPIGVPEAIASATPAAVNETRALALNTTQPLPASDVEPANVPAPSPVTAFSDNAPEREVAAAPEPPALANPSASPQAQEPAPVMANNTTTLPAATNSSEVVSANEVEPAPAPVKSAQVAASAVVQQTPAKKTVMREVRRAEPAEDEPQVRRAEPAPPEEGPATAAPEIVTSAPPQQTDSLAQTEESRDAEPEPAGTTVKRIEPEPRVASKPPIKKTERPAKPKRQVNKSKRTYPPQPLGEFEGPPPPPSPRGRVRARFVGVTADGRWMLELPSNKIIIVPPPPSQR